jgi:hypothetical protein
VSTRARFLPALERRPCAFCGGPIGRRAAQVKAAAPTCSRACQRAHAKHRRATTPTTILRGGYHYVLVGIGVPGADQLGYKSLARITMEGRLGRPLAGNERVIRLDGNRQNDHPKNLVVRRIAIFAGDGALS